MKENNGFRRFGCRTSEKVYKEFMRYTIGRNRNPYHRFLRDKIKKFEGKTEEPAVWNDLFPDSPMVKSVRRH